MGPAADYREILQRQFAQRRERNAGYSQRAFARDLGISPSRLSEVLSPDHRLSRPMAMKIGKNLGLPRRELAELCDLADLEHPRSPAIRDRARARLSQRPTPTRLSARVPAAARREVLEDEVEMIASWHHLAILEMLGTATGGKATRSEIGALFGLSESEVGISLGRLERLKLVRCKGERVSKTARDFATTHDIPSEAIKRLHASLMRRAEDALRKQPVEQRSFNSLVLAVSREKLPLALERLHEFVRAFNDEMCDGAETTKDAVYCLGLQFFALTNPVKATDAVRHDRPS